MADKDKPERLETEPIFGIHIEFCDGSRPMEWFNLNLKQATVVLQEYSEDWILIPDKECQLNGSMWNWHANIRHKTKKKEIEYYADILDPDYIPEVICEEEEQNDDCQ